MTDPGPERDSWIRLIRAASFPPPVLPPPELPPELEALAPPAAPPLRGIRAALFDIYGTLFISAAGDISAAAEAPAGDLAPAGAPAAGAFPERLEAPAGPLAPATEAPAGAPPAGAFPERLEALAGEHGCSAAELRDYFRAAVLERHEALRGETAWPELQVEELWAQFLARQGKPQDGARELALRYELAVNPAYPMPAAAQTLALLQSRGIVLGLISNAQFFTPLLFEAFFRASPESLGFDSGLLIYSFELGEAKPSPSLFAPAKRRLEALGLKPENAVYIGNDMLNDIFAAARAGFKTTLFAGDRRSLRLRQGDPRIEGLMPDRVARGLPDLGGLIG